MRAVSRFLSYLTGAATFAVAAWMPFPSHAETYTAMSTQTATPAEVVAVRDVLIQAKPGRTGTYVGTAIGGASGYALTRNSSSRGRALGTLVGGAVGAGAGTWASQPRAHHGFQIVVRTLNANGRPSGQMIAVLQDEDQGLRPGDRALLLRGAAHVSVSPWSAP